MWTLLRGPTGKIGHVKTSDSPKTQTVASIEDLETSTMKLQTPHGSNLTTVGTRRRERIFPERRTRSSHISARARIGARSGLRGGIDAASTAVKRSCNGDARRRSQLSLQEGQAAAAALGGPAARLELRESIARERLARFPSDQNGRTHVLLVRAAVLVRAKSRKAFGREAFPR